MRAKRPARFRPTSTTNVFFCGFTSEASFGAWAYLIVRPPEEGGNILVDSPRFSAPLVKRIEEMGGVALMFLSHRDDIADHAKFAAHFRCPRVMHQGDGAEALGIEHVTNGEEPVALGADLICDSDARSHARSSGAVVSRAGALYRRSPRVVTRRAIRSSPFATPAGIHGPFRHGRWSGCWTIASNGCCRDMAASTTPRPPRCTSISYVVSRG